MEKNEESIQVNENKIKSEFEKKLIESFKQAKVVDSYELLLQAYNELPKYIEDIKDKKISLFILNINIIDKINRIIKRNYININILISKIIYSILDASNFQILSDDSHTLINFTNTCINVLDIISLYELSHNLTKRIITFLKYLENNPKKYLDSEQTEMVKNLQKTLSEKITSHSYISFKNNYQNSILSYFSKESLGEKEKGLLNLYSYFFRFSTINEQFDLLCEYGHLILNSIINQPNPSYIELYYKTADFIISFIYNFYFIIKVNDDNHINTNNFYLYDNMDINITDINNVKLENFENLNSCKNLSFLDKKKFELGEQKNFLLNYTNIFSLCTTIVSCLIIYESSFDCQFAAYLILKRLYFIFPQYRNKIEDLITTTLVNIVSFKTEIIKNKNEQCEIFLKYLLQNGEKELKEKLILRLNTQKAKIEKNYIEESNNNVIEKKDTENDIILLNDFNLRVGCPMNMEIKAGFTEEKLVEIRHPNSLLYIGFNTIGLNISLRLAKFCPNLEGDSEVLKKLQFEQQEYFYEIFKVEKIEGSKIILFVKNPGIYKVIFDNKYSWFNSKLIRYRLSILKEMENNDEKNNENNITNNDDNNKKDDNNNDDNIGINKDNLIENNENKNVEQDVKININ